MRYDACLGGVQFAKCIGRQRQRQRWRHGCDYSFLFNLNKINDSCVSFTFFFFFRVFVLRFLVCIPEQRPVFAIVLNGSKAAQEKKRKVNAKIETKNEWKMEKGEHFYCHESRTILLNNTLNIYQRF